MPTADTIEILGYAQAGTPALAELLGNGADAPTCARCGAPLRHVFVTSIGALGGDCVATLTGDNSTRAIVRRMERVIDGDTRMSRIYVQCDSATHLEITVSADQFKSTTTTASARVGTLAHAVLRWYIDARGVKVIRR